MKDLAPGGGDLLRQAQFALFGRFVFAVDPSNILRITPVKNLVATHADEGCIKGVSGEANIENILVLMALKS